MILKFTDLKPEQCSANFRLVLAVAMFSVVLLATAEWPDHVGRPKLFNENLAWYYSLDSYQVFRDDWGTNDTINVGSTTASNGLLGQAAFFNGTTKALTAASNSTLCLGGDKPFTVSFWCYTGTSNQAFAGTVGKNASASPFTNDEWRLDYRNGQHFFQVGLGAASALWVASTNLQLANEWTFVVAWRDAPTATLTNINIQVNTSRAKMTETGFLQTSNAWFPCGCSSKLEIGEQRAGSFFIGYIDDIGCWTNRALSAQERSMLYNAGYGGLGRFLTARGGGNP